ncbi:kinase-like protein, partial [Rhizophagus irregularis]
IHKENLIHRDLHSGNILYDYYTNSWFISDFGFCGPADNQLKSIYGNLPYIAPEVIIGKNYSFASDIYSIGILMWEISSGQPPFTNFEHDYNLTMNIINGMRPKTILGIPIKFENLMEQCWDADPLKRPDIKTLWKKINGLNLLYQTKSNELIQNISLKINNLENDKNDTFISKLFSIKTYRFKNFLNLKNTTKNTKKEYSEESNFPIFSNLSINPEICEIFSSAQVIRGELVNEVLNRANALLDYNNYNSRYKQYEFIRQMVLADKLLTKVEKTEAIRLLTKYDDKEKVFHNKGIKRICENCSQECLATLHCEYCVKNYLEASFSNWTSENNNIDDLIQK